MTRHRPGPSRAAALAVLGLHDGATAAEISQRFRVLAKAHHPDTAGPSAEAAQRLTAICDAYHQLTRPPVPPPAEPPAPPAAGTAARPDTTGHRRPAAMSSMSFEPSESSDAGGAWLVAGPARLDPLPNRERPR